MSDQEDAARYRAMRSLAIAKGPGRLEAFVALEQLDYISDADKFDAVVDAMRAKNRIADGIRLDPPGASER